MDNNCNNSIDRCNNDEAPLNSRKDFLGKSMALLTTAVVSGSLVGALTGCSTKEEESKSSAGKVAVLGVDGKLMYVDKAHFSENYHPVPAAPTNTEVRKGIKGKKFVMVIDLAKCDGCGLCTTACQKMHYTPPEREWIKVYEMQNSENTAPYYFPKPCLQCDEPPCTKVCPVDATFKREDGIVLVDNERCIGCRFCMAACPYEARFFNWGEPNQPELANVEYSPEKSFPAKKGTVEKCDFCAHTLREGILPACVNSCPMGAIYMGDENEDAVTNGQGVTVKFKQLLEDNDAYRFMEDLGTKPRVYYLPAKNRMFPKPDSHA